jgi:hypothetical protein
MMYFSLVALGLILGTLSGADMAVAARVLPRVGVQGASVSEKQARTPAQRKINSQLLIEIYRRRGQAAAKRVPAGATGVKIDEAGRALVDVRADVTPALESRVTALGGIIVSSSPEHRSTIAWVPLLRLERLAQHSTVRAIEPAAQATTAR